VATCTFMFAVRKSASSSSVIFTASRPDAI
jgi:hypothetical protein